MPAGQRGAPPARPAAERIGRRPGRDTAQRRAILAALCAAPDHPTAAEIHRRARRALPGLGLATVYRTLARLVGEGALGEVRGLSGRQRFDGDTAIHDHLVCTACRRIVDVQVARPAAFGGATARRHGFVLTAHHVELAGVCSACRAKEHGGSRRKR